MPFHGVIYETGAGGGFTSGRSQKQINTKSKSNVKSGGQECPPYNRAKSKSKSTSTAADRSVRPTFFWEFIYIWPLAMANFYQLFRECAERLPESVALEIQRGDAVESYTYAQLREMAESIGRWLVENGFRVGDRAAILADNHPRWVASYLGIIVMGGTAVPLDTALHTEQVAKLLKDSGSTLLFVGSKYLAAAQKAVRDLPVKLVLTDTTAATGAGTVAGDLEAIFRAGSRGFSPPPVAEDVVASLLYTSGTTADPKGVMLTHANLMGEVKAVFSVVQIGPNDALLGVLPLFHVLSQMANLLLPLVKGARVVYLETLNTTELLRALSERHITVFAVVPQFFYLIHERIFKEVAKRGKVATAMVRALMGVTAFQPRVGMESRANFLSQDPRSVWT